ncbi:MAG: glycine betaine ABC transporter substrate-binding protein [Phycicoccus sp.]|nr:glycine betaine ABC transporter substrate-binding protein [Phycicoccus sp.]
MTASKTLLALVAAGSLTLGLAAWGSGTSKVSSGGGAATNATDNALKGATFTVSSKDFTESILLGKITGAVLAAHGATIVDKTNIKGSVNVREALTSGQVDMYWEYTGTAWITYLKNTKPVADPQAQFDAVKTADAKNGIAWLPMAPMNDTYAFATTADVASKLTVSSLSDLAKINPSDLTFCIESEFSTRDDGFPGMTKAYGLNVPKSNIKMLDTGVIYKTTAQGGTCNFGEVFATDGRIAALKLKVLADDKHFFPNYNASLTIKESLLAKYPKIADYIAPVAAKLDNATMTDLNAKVDAQGMDPGDVANQWLKSAGLIK